MTVTSILPVLSLALYLLSHIKPADIRRHLTEGSGGKELRQMLGPAVCKEPRAWRQILPRLSLDVTAALADTLTTFVETLSWGIPLSSVRSPGPTWVISTHCFQSLS